MAAHALRHSNLRICPHDVSRHVMTFHKKAFRNPSWFVGQVSRQTINSHLLSPPCRDGSFVVRNSQTSDDIAISVRQGNDVKHYIIHQDREGFFYVNTSRSGSPPFFKSISELIQYYQEHQFGNKGFILTKALLQVRYLPILSKN
ncbi:unnamed protein product, partial [Meganyctiphanes norvegica]